MSDSLVTDKVKLEWAGRLSAALLNDGTDAVRWFLLQHLPGRKNGKPNLFQVISENKTLLEDLRDGRNVKRFINHEMFDILFREDGKETDEGDLEISLIFVLIRKITEKVSSVTIMLKKYQASQMPSSNEQHLAREPKVPDPCITAWYLGDFLRDMQKVEWKTRATVCRFLCKVKHASWKLWDEEPKSYQVSPLFDVIRLVRFKERMKDIVHAYEITEDTFKAAWKYLTSLLDRLMCYKISARRWVDDVINPNEDFRSVCGKLVDIMVWQTKSLEERDEIYLVLKNNRRLQAAEGKHYVETCSEFLSQFGQQHRYNLSAVNNPKVNWYTVTDLQERTFVTKYKESLLSPAQRLNVKSDSEANTQHCLRDEKVGTDDETEIQKQKLSDCIEIPMELKILNQINNRVFIKESQPSEDAAGMDVTLRKILRKRYLIDNESILPFPLERNISIPMDKINPNLEAVRCETPDQNGNEHCESETVKKLSQSDFISSVPESTPLPTWRHMLHGMASNDAPRILISGAHSSGKTVLLRKIAYDWASQNDMNLASFRFVFYIDLALVPSDKPYTRLSDCILEQCVLSDTTTISSDDIEDVFTDTKGSGILLLLDGIERLPNIKSDEMTEFFDVIRLYLWPKCAVILTTAFPCYLHQEDGPIQNVRSLVCEASVAWKKYLVAGLTQHDVKQHAHLYFAEHLLSSCSIIQFKKLAQMFQKDIYDAIKTSPMAIYMLCRVFFLHYSDHLHHRSSTTRSNCLFPETMGEILRTLFSSFFPALDSTKNHSTENFMEEILRRKLAEDSNNLYLVSSTCLKELSLLINEGILVTLTSADRNAENTLKTYYTFSHVLFEDYIASRIFMRNCNTCKAKSLEVLQKSITSLSKAIRLHSFLMLCCSHGDESSALISNFLSELLRSSSMKLNSPDINDSSVHEATKLLILRCRYETRCSKTVSNADGLSCMNFLENDLTDPVVNLDKTYAEDHKWHSSFRAKCFRSDGCVLQLNYTNLLSNSSKQALLSFTSSCSPALSISGSVFPVVFSRPTTFWIRSLRLFNLHGQQMQFVSHLVKELPFLEEAYFPEVVDMEDDHVNYLNSCFSSRQQSSTPLMLHTLVLTARLSTDFHQLPLTSYAEVGRMLSHLPHLERLEVTIASQELFFSIFARLEPDILVPLTEISLIGTDFDEKSCRLLADIFNRLIFVQRIYLSQNPIYNGLVIVSSKFHNLRDLQVLALKKACLTKESILALANALKQPDVFQSLRYLDVSENYIQSEEVMLTLIDSLKYLEALEYLDLSQNFVGDTSACALAKSLKGHINITNLRLDCVQIGPVALSSLKYHLRSCEKLANLSMAENYFGQQALEFAAVLHPDENPKIDNDCGLPSLIELDLSGVSDNLPTKCSSSAVATFVKGIKFHKRIRAVHLLHYKMSFTDLIELLNVCEQHTSIQLVTMSKRFLQHDSLETSSWSCLTSK